MTFSFDLTATIAGLPNPSSFSGALLTATLQHDGGEGDDFDTAFLPVQLVFVAGALTSAKIDAGVQGATQPTFWIASMGTSTNAAGTEDPAGQWTVSVASATQLDVVWTPTDTAPIAGQAELCIGPELATV
jgi:hypothetical protein